METTEQPQGNEQAKKKKIIVIVAVVALLLLCACGIAFNDGEGEPRESLNLAVGNDAQNLRVGEAAEIAGVKIAVTDISDGPQDRSGKITTRIEIAVDNVSDSSFTLKKGHFVVHEIGKSSKLSDVSVSETDEIGYSEKIDSGKQKTVAMYVRAGDVGSIRYQEDILSDPLAIWKTEAQLGYEQEQVEREAAEQVLREAAEEERRLADEVAEEERRIAQEARDAKNAPKVALNAKLSLDSAWEAAAAYGKREYPAGFKLHYIIGKLAEEPLDEDTWFLKAECTVTNEYGTKLKGLVCEIKVTGTTDNPTVTHFRVY